MTDRLDRVIDSSWFGKPKQQYLWALCAWHARNAYQADPRSAIRLRGNWRGTLTPFVSGHRRGYVWSTRSDAIIAIAGSDDLRDWQDNVRCACPEPVGYRVRVHRGFAEHAEALRLVLDEAAFERLERRRVTIVGHSLGGAVALLLPLFSMLPEVRRAEVVTFGAPRAGDAGLRRFLSDRPVTQLVNDGDPVPMLPLRGPIFGYRHAGRVIHLTDRATWSDAWSHRYSRIAQACAAGLVPRSIRSRIACRVLAAFRSHQMASYVARLLDATEALDDGR